MSRRGRQQFKTNISAQFPTTGTGAIGANRIRTHLGEDVPDSHVNNVDDLQLLTTATGINDYLLAGMITAYVSGFAAIIKFGSASTGACTLNVNSVDVKKLYKNPTTQAGSGDIPANQILIVIYDSTLDTGAGGFLIIGSVSILGGSHQRVSFDTTIAIPIMDMGGDAERTFVESAPVNANRELAFSNDTAMIRATTFLSITGATRSITMPANVLIDPSKWVWTKPATKFIWAADIGVYRLEWFHDGTNMHLDIYGYYSSTL